MNSVKSALDRIDKSNDKKRWKTVNNECKKAKAKYERIEGLYYEVQNYINELYNVDREWFDKLDNLTDLDCNEVDVTISMTSSKTAFMPDYAKDSGGLVLYGATYALPKGYSKNQIGNQFSFENKYGHPNNITIEMTNISPMKKFWHELGHVFWFTTPSESNSNQTNSYFYYNVYLKLNPNYINEGGHGPGNIQNKPTEDAEKRYETKLKTLTNGK